MKALIGGAETGAGHGIEWLTPVVGHEGSIGLVWLFINFIVLMWLLEKLLFAKLRQRQRDKHDLVSSELERATRAREEAEAVMADYDNRLRNLESETAELLDSARKRAEADRRQIIEQAEREAERIRSAARAAAERETEFHRRRLEAEVVDRAVERAEALLRDRITPADQQRMVDGYVGQLTAVELQGHEGGSP